MKVIILAGGRGERMREETDFRPKPMVEIGHKPILWHIMKIYSYWGFNDFIICLGYKGQIIKDYFLNYAAKMYDCKLQLGNGWIDILQKNEERDWNVTLVDTGIDTQTGGRLKRVEKYTDGERVLVTYGDGVSNVNIPALIKQHEEDKKFATLTSIYNKSKFGQVEVDKDHKVITFEEKSTISLINGGFFVFEPEVFDYIIGDKDILESDTLYRLTATDQLSAYKHEGFWGCMDNAKEIIALNQIWDTGKAPWKLWHSNE